MAKQALQRTDLLDTDLDFHRKFIRGLRKLQPGEKVTMTFELIRSLQQLKRAAGRARTAQ